MVLRYINILSILLLFGIVFRATLGSLFGVVGNNIAFAILYFSVPLLFLKKIKINRYNIAQLVFVFYCFILFLIYPVFDWYGNYVSGFIGFSNLAASILFWIVMSNFNCDTVKVLKAVMLMLIFNALGAIVQYFVSPDVFGLVHHNVYSEEALVSKSNVLKRAISFIASPQSLSITMGVGLSLTFYFLSGYKRWFIAALFLVAGVLTVSKAFYIYLIVSVLWFYRKSFHYLLVSIPFIFATVFTFVPQENSILNRILKIPFYILNIEQYSAYQIWMKSVSYSYVDFGYIFGRGIGVFSRGSQMLLGYQIDTNASNSLTTGSTESFIIQLFVETGLVGLVIWGVLFLLSVKNILLNNTRESDILTGILISIFIISFFTPSLYGFVTAVVFYFILVNGRSLSKPMVFK